MKPKDLKELKTKSLESLKKEIERLTRAKNEAKIERDMSKTKNVHHLSKIKKDIAQLLTLTGEKSFAEKKVKAIKPKEQIDAAN